MIEEMVKRKSMTITTTMTNCTKLWNLKPQHIKRMQMEGNQSIRHQQRIDKLHRFHPFASPWQIIHITRSINLPNTTQATKKKNQQKQQTIPKTILINQQTKPQR